MRILYIDALKSANTLTADDVAPNYPVSNLTNNTPLLEFRSTTNQANITATFTQDFDVSAFAVANHNLATLRVVLKNIGDTVLFDQTYTNAELIFNTIISRRIVYLDTLYAGVRKIELEAVGSGTLRIGHLWFGDYIGMPPFDSQSTIAREYTGRAESNRWGINFPQAGVTIETFECNFNGLTVSDYDKVNQLFALAGQSNPVWVDRWEDSAEFVDLFGIITADITYTKNEYGVLFDELSLAFREIR